MKKSELRQLIKEEISKVIKEEEEYQEDYDTGGYIEAMHPNLFNHVEAIVKIFKDWKNSPMSEPGMEGYAKDDLVDYITIQIRNA